MLISAALYEPPPPPSRSILQSCFPAFHLRLAWPENGLGWQGCGAGGAGWGGEGEDSSWPLLGREGGTPFLRPPIPRFKVSSLQKTEEGGGLRVHGSSRPLSFLPGFRTTSAEFRRLCNTPQPYCPEQKRGGRERGRGVHQKPRPEGGKHPSGFSRSSGNHTRWRGERWRPPRMVPPQGKKGRGDLGLPLNLTSARQKGPAHEGCREMPPARGGGSSSAPHGCLRADLPPPPAFAPPPVPARANFSRSWAGS